MDQNIPQTLSQVLQVYKLVRKSRYERIKAMHEVARVERTSYPTIASACTRGLAIRHIDELDDFLLSKNTKAFRDRLVQHFPGYQSLIENFFTEYPEGKEALSENGAAKAVRPLLPKEEAALMNILRLRKVTTELSKWKERNDLPNDHRQDIQGLLDQISDS